MNAQLKQVPNVLTHCGITITSELITPAYAARILERNSCNRRLRPPVVRGYAEDMRSGNWYEATPNIVCILPDGSLGNSQHTLSAIVESGVSLGMLVARNVPKDAVARMDRGLTRTITDIARFLDLDFESRKGTIALVCDKGAEGTGNRGVRKSFDVTYAAYMRHREAVDFAFEIAPKSHDVGMSATMLGVIARASYSHPRERLVHFMEIVKTGICASPAELGAMKYRDWCMKGKTSGSEGQKEIYRRGQAALMHFLDGSPITKLYGMDGDVFGTPAE